MLDLILFCICVSLACTIIHIAVTWDGMVLNFIGKWHGERIEKMPSVAWFYKPLFSCLICMCSFWTIIFWLLYIKPITFELLFAILITGGINVVIRCVLNATTEDDGC